MTVDKNKNGTSVTYAVSGRLDTTSAPELEKIIRTELDGITELTFDFSKLDYISSAGLRILLAAQKTMNAQGAMKVTGVNEIVSEIFDVTGFSEILTIEDNAEEEKKEQHNLRKEQWHTRLLAAVMTRLKPLSWSP